VLKDGISSHLQGFLKTYDETLYCGSEQPQLLEHSSPSRTSKNVKSITKRDIAD